jgi:hypothetical protein
MSLPDLLTQMFHARRIALERFHRAADRLAGSVGGDEPINR